MNGLLSNVKLEFFNHGFFIKQNTVLIGYVKISQYHDEEKSVYLRAAIAKNKRGYGYGTLLLNEVTEYIFQNYPQVENIYLKIAPDNKPSLMTANACGYLWLEKDLYGKKNPYYNYQKK